MTLQRMTGRLLAVAALHGMLSCGGDPGSPIACDEQPNYVAEVQLLYWLPGDAPMAVFYDRRGEPPAGRAADGRPIGVDLSSVVNAFAYWDGSISLDLIGSVSTTDSARPIRMRWGYAEGARGVTIVTFGQNGQIHDAEIIIDPQIAAEAYVWNNEITIAHEVGHALGIQGHSSGDDLMQVSRGSFEEPSSVPTQADVNTMRTAYCAFRVESSAASTQANGEGGRVAAIRERARVDPGLELTGPVDGLYTLTIKHRA